MLKISRIYNNLDISPPLTDSCHMSYLYPTTSYISPTYVSPIYVVTITYLMEAPWEDIPWPVLLANVHLVEAKAGLSRLGRAGQAGGLRDSQAGRQAGRKTGRKAGRSSYADRQGR